MDSKRASSRTDVGRFARRATLGAVSLALLATASDASAQIAGTTNRPLPNVLLLVDSSGSMERMPDNSLPSQNRGLTAPFNSPTMGANPPNACTPGATSNPNRWGMLVQALTGNMQPYFSCDAVDRATNAFKNEYRIGGTAAANLPYDLNYFVPYHRPLTGITPNACAYSPYKLPGAGVGAGVGAGGGGAGGDSASFPPDAFTSVKNSHLVSSYGGSANGSPLTLGGVNDCSFDQAPDGQLDATKAFIRFGLMTFDNDPDNGIGVVSTPPGGNVSATPFLGQWSYTTPGVGVGQIPGCGFTTPFEVGARHWAAPPWEGRMVRFPDPDGSLYDIERTNDEIQKVLLGTRPYGATPIDGMMNDARDYFWLNAYGPLGTVAGYFDPYVDAACRDQYIVLLTDGAPNLDLRPACQGVGGTCPYPDKSARVAELLSSATGKQHVKTFVIGFSVNGAGNAQFVNDGFPAPYDVAPANNCKSFYNGITGYNAVTGVHANPNAMNALCSGAGKPPAGSTADACCQLAEIAYYGNAPGVRGTPDATPPFFAETQADLVLSFGRVLGGIAKNATTRTLPGYAPSVSISGTSVTADFVASFIPNAQKVWSGEIDRKRSICSAAGAPTPQASDAANGDSYAQNLAVQSNAGKRLFVSWKVGKVGAALPFTGDAIDSAQTVRPFSATADGILAPVGGAGVQVRGLDMALAAEGLWAEALEIDAGTCKRSRAVDSSIIPALGKDDCTKVIWGFAAAHAASQGPLKFGPNLYDFNARCKAGSSTVGFCSISTSDGCDLNDPTSCPAGQACVPECSALGAVFRSSPTLVGAPSELLRDNDYRALAEQRKLRRPAMFVATTDGVLHAFKALSTPATPAHDVRPGEYEMWAFIPPAVLPRLASNYPTGQQILLDGTPVVKDIVWDRLRAEPPYHTTLVAGLGAGGGGYYALNVTDVDCQGNGSVGIAGNPDGCLDLFTAQTTLPNIAAASAVGPHFLWQLTDVPCVTPGATCTDTAKITRKSRDGITHVALFGKESGTPALATVNVNPGDGTVRQIGVAILPGGIDGTPVKGASCARAVGNGAFTPLADWDASEGGVYRLRTSVRQWAPGGCGAPVPGRSVTIVRADTGEIIRHFGRVGVDVPGILAAGKVINSPFDSPVIGTPAVFPSGVGVTAQRIFVGDADGTTWRIDVSSTEPSNWKVTLFQDVISRDLPATPTFAASQPIQVPPVLTQDSFGGIILNVATGDQENIIASTDQNYVMSVQEQRAQSATVPGKSLVRWFLPLTDTDGSVRGERVTGPMTVFDRTLYFASYRPAVPTTGAACLDGGRAMLWGMDFANPAGVGIDAGGLPRWCPLGNVDVITGNCTAITLVQSQPASLVSASLANAIIPGVTVRATQACAATGGAGNDYINSLSATKFDLFFGSAGKGASGGATGGAPAAARASVARPLPRQAANIDSWALVID